MPLVTYDAITTSFGCGGGDYFKESWTSYWNNYYTASESAVERRSVMTHELGHALGLADWGGPHDVCTTVPVMNGYTQHRYEDCNVYIPRQDDIDGANTLYP